MKVFPLVILVILHSHCFTFAIGVNKRYRERVLFGIKASIITETQGPIYSRSSDRSPEVDDLKTPFKEFRNISRREMSVDPSDG